MSEILRQRLHRAIEPFDSGLMKVDARHRLYYEQSGNRDGYPLLVVHGGPGGGSSPVHRRMFNPHHWRIILFDQRGCGRSHPYGELTDNTTEHLIADMEALREKLGVEKWVLFGGSWGSTLILAYAQRHPDRVAGMIMRGIFLMTRAEIDWFLHGMGRVFPEAYKRFTGFLRPEERGDILESYYSILTGNDHARAKAAARIWVGYETACSSFQPAPDTMWADRDDPGALAMARLETHYFRNCLFEPEDSLLRGIDRIRHIPAAIVQGRYDIVCPIITADRLHEEWPEADYMILPDAGHASMEPAMLAALMEAAQTFERLRF